jgi:saccharopine dehydrogenase (NADP+, L-glutamate forming)
LFFFNIFFQGFVEAVKAIKAIGYLSTEKRDFLNAKNPQQPSWRQATATLLNVPGNTSADQLKQALTQKLDFENKEAGICAVEALGLLSDEPCPGKDTPLDTLAQHLAEALKYGPEERDLVVLNHDIEAAFPNGVVVRGEWFLKYTVF